jgi:uncharacterized membrane protein YgcG
LFDNIFAAIEKWMRELLTGMVESNMSTMFTDVNEKTSEIAAQVGRTPQNWNSSVFSMIQNLSESVVVPIAGIIITLVLCYELISMLTERNNLHDVDTWMFFKYFVKAWVAIYLVSNLELEKKLDEQIRQMESTHPGYDEYRYQLDEIGHDPYQLISHLTAVYEQFTRGQVKTVIKSLFEQQYLLKVWETIEIRTRMETRVGIRPTIDAFGNVSMETYTYQEEVEYEYKILNVLLKNKGFDTIARKNMDRKQTGRYDAYNLTYGNRPELFGAGSPTYSGGTTGSIGSGGSGGTGGSSGGGFRYDIPEEALSDEKFARMIAEAEKYLGMPYVWGGSSPSTSFDCSGFVCWVINNCGNGWNVGRTTANGLRGKCSYVSPANAQPGDLIFFEKTYNTVGASHVGIYVGNGMMIHCGDPISYTSINSTYWQNHFLGFGRIK